MLLFQFAMGLGIRQLILFTKEAAKLEGMGRAFNNLSGGTNNAQIAMSKLQEATNDTMSEFDLLQQANNAMILGVTKNADEMANMFDMAQRLGQALGKDVKLSVESLITGMGRQSRLMLDNIGIVVDMKRAYEDFANANNLSADSLTDAQRKQAFMNATLAAGEKKLKGIGKEVLSSDSQFQRLGAASQNLSADIGEALLPVVEPLADGMVALSKAINPAKIQRFAVAVGTSAATIGVARLATIGWTNANIALFGALNAVRIAIVTNPVTAIAAAMGLAVGGVLTYFNAFEDATEEIKANNETQKELEKTIRDISSAFETANKAVNDSAILQIQYKEALGEISKEESKHLIIKEKLQQLNKELNSLDLTTADGLARKIEIGNSILKLDIESLNLTNEQLDALAKEIDLNQKSIDNAIEKETLLNEEINLLEKRKLHFGDDIAFAEAEIGIMQTQLLSMTDKLDITKLQLEIDLKQLDVDNEKTKKKKELIALEKAEYKQTFDNSIKFLALNDKNAKHIAKIQGIAAIVNAYSAAQSQYEQVSKILPPPAPQIAYASAIALGLGQAAKVSGMFEQGGMVGGRRHSQGGTIIEAEQGEFVMSRSAVEAVGIENMNRINQGGGAGITVNVSGNVMTQDFVENDLAEAIKEAARKGADFGIS
tara:strand:- start:547 stop:2520 length:1974 start_codon:yes stop_codon:yes gene_type:complete